MISPFDYHDFRAYLADWFKDRKMTVPTYSHRIFARKADSGNPSLLLHVIQDRRNITSDLLPNFVRALGLGHDEAEYFTLLVAFGQAKDREARDVAWGALVDLRARLRGANLDAAELKVLSRWFYTAVHQLAVCAGFCADPVWIVGRINPRITTEEAAEALAVLMGIGMLVSEEDRVVPRDLQVATSPFVRAHGTAPYHVQHHRIAGDLLDRLWTEHDPDLERRTMFIGATAAIPASRLPELREMLWAAQRRILAHCDEWAAEGSDEVVHLRLSLFPLTRASVPD